MFEEIFSVCKMIKLIHKRTWISDVQSSDFCPDGSHECTNAKMPSCQDRTIQCLDPLPVPVGLIKQFENPDDVITDHSIGAKYTYTCQNEGKVPLLYLSLGCHIYIHPQNVANHCDLNHVKWVCKSRLSQNNHCFFFRCLLFLVNLD